MKGNHVSIKQILNVHFHIRDVIAKQEAAALRRNGKQQQWHAQENGSLGGSVMQQKNNRLWQGHTHFGGMGMQVQVGVKQALLMVVQDKALVWHTHRHKGVRVMLVHVLVRAREVLTLAA